MALNNIENVTLIEEGLGDKAGTFAYIQEGLHNLGGSHFSQDAPEETVQVMKLPMRMGDEVIATVNPDLISLLKIDVEGFELAVLSGLQRTIATHRPVILFEIHPEENRLKAMCVVDLLRSLGYDHLYTCEYERGAHQSKVVRGFLRLLRGVSHKPRKITTIKDCEYRMLVAVQSPL